MKKKQLQICDLIIVYLVFVCKTTNLYQDQVGSNFDQDLQT